MNSGFDFSELVKKAIKYLCEGLIIGIVSYAIPKKKLDMEEVIIIGLPPQHSPSSTCSPSIGASARGGVGFRRFGVNWRNKVGLTPAHYSIM
jgi:hypothetical protein